MMSGNRGTGVVFGVKFVGDDGQTFLKRIGKVLLDWDIYERIDLVQFAQNPRESLWVFTELFPHVKFDTWYDSHTNEIVVLVFTEHEENHGQLRNNFEYGETKRLHGFDATLLESPLAVTGFLDRKPEWFFYSYYS